MLRWALLTVLVLPAACRDGGGADLLAVDATVPVDAAAVDAVSLCTRLCAVRDQVACARTIAGCPDACAMGLGGACGPDWALAYGCAVQFPATDYVCDMRGQPQLKDGLCADSFAAVTRCIAAAPASR